MALFDNNDLVGFNPGFLKRQAMSGLDNLAATGEAALKVPAKLANAGIQGAMYATDEDYGLRAKESPQVSGNILPFAKSKQELEDITAQVMLGKSALEINDTLSLEKSIVSQKERGVTKADAMKNLADAKDKLDPHAFQMLSLQLEQQYKNNSYVQDEQIQNTAQRNENIANSKGDSNGVVTPEKPETKGLATVVESTATNTAFKQFEEMNWYDSDSFARSLTTFGMNMLAGNGIPNSYMAASREFDSRFAVERRQSMANELLGMGYSRPQIMEWVQTGKSDILQRYTQDEDKYGVYQVDQEGKKNYIHKFDPLGDSLKVARINAANAKAAGGSKKETEADKLSRVYYTMANRGNLDYANWSSENKNFYNQATGGVKDVANAALTDLVFSGSETNTALAKKMNPQLVELIEIERNTIAPLLRKESGAAISSQEWKTYANRIFPRPGDTPKQIERKRQYRDAAISAIRSGYDEEMKLAIDGLNRGTYKNLVSTEDGVFVYNGKNWLQI